MSSWQPPAPFLWHRRSMHAPGARGLCPDNVTPANGLAGKRFVVFDESIEVAEKARRSTFIALDDALASLAQLDERQAKVGGAALFSAGLHHRRKLPPC